MKTRNTLALSLLLLLPTPIWAAPGCPIVFTPSRSEKAVTIFEEMEFYQENFCHSNAHCLIQILEKEGASLADYQILLLIPSNWAEAINPRKPRSGIDAWTFHVVLERAGRITDPDFEGLAIEMEKRDYFLEMFGNGRNRMDDFFVKKIAAEEYLNDFVIESIEGGRTWDHYAHDDEAYPRILLEDYLR